MIPFHIFVAKHPENLPAADLEVYENQFMLYNTNEEKLSELKEEFKKIIIRLHELSDAGKMDEYTRHCLLDMTKKVVKNLTAKHERVQKGIKKGFFHWLRLPSSLV